MVKTLDRRSFSERRSDNSENKHSENRKQSVDRRMYASRRSSGRIFKNFSEAVITISGVKSEVEIVNLGNRGICLSSVSFLGSEGTTANLTFRTDNQKAILNTTIIWEKKNDNENKYYYGLMINNEEDKLIALKKMLWLSDEYVNQTIRPKLWQLKLPFYIRDEILRFFTVDVRKFIDKYYENEVAYMKGDRTRKQVQSIVDKIVVEIVENGDKLISSLTDKKTQQKIKEMFREMVGGWVYQSDIVKYALFKPRGYPGDYKIIEIVYNNKLLSKKIGHCSDLYFLNDRYAVAVRNRKNLMGKILREQIKRIKDGVTLRIMNAACGSSREIKELFEKDIHCKGKVLFSLIDHDKEALDYSNDTLIKVKPEWAELDLIEENLLRLRPGNDKYVNKFAGYDILYSIGLADYLPDKILGTFFEFCKKVMAGNGCFIIAHKDKDKYKPLPPNWYCDWNFIPRNKEQFLDMLRNAFGDGFSYEVIWEPSNTIFFVIIKRCNN